jgi:RecA-family ATPase
MRAKKQFHIEDMEDADNFADEPPPVHSPDEYGAPEPPQPPRQPLQWLDMSNWDNEPVPQRKWIIKDLIPANQAGLLSGDAGAGKTIIELMKDVAHVAGKDWMYTLPEPGPAFYIGSEDDEVEIHIRLADIAKHYGGLTFKQLIEGGLRLLCLLGQDMTLCAAMGKSGRVETTSLYDQIYEQAGDLKPRNISIDPLAKAFAGNEIDRRQVTEFATYMQRLAMAAGGAVTVLSHPSLQGTNTGSGLSGSTGWHNAFRTRGYMRKPKQASNAEDEEDSDLRVLEFKKNQYGPIAKPIGLRYRHGLFLPEGGSSSLDKLARESLAEQIFLLVLDRYTLDGRNVSENNAARNFAPKMFAQESDAKANRLRKEDLNSAMLRLFENNKIHLETYGRLSRQAERIARGPREANNQGLSNKNHVDAWP